MDMKESIRRYINLSAQDWINLYESLLSSQELEVDRRYFIKLRF